MGEYWRCDELQLYDRSFAGRSPSPLGVFFEEQPERGGGGGVLRKKAQVEGGHAQERGNLDRAGGHVQPLNGLHFRMKWAEVSWAQAKPHKLHFRHRENTFLPIQCEVMGGQCVEHLCEPLVVDGRC